MKFKTTLLLTGSLFVAMAGLSPAHAAVDEAAAQALAKKNDCFKCHAVDKSKKGPAFQKVAATYKGNAGAEDKLSKFLSAGGKIKVDGADEDHKALDTKDAKEVKNLVQWILSR